MGTTDVTKVDMATFQGLIQKDPVTFFDDALGCTHWSKQDEIARAVFFNQRVAVKSCFGVGKTFISARIALAFQFAWKNSIVITTAPTFRQVENILWREIRSAHATAKIPLGGKMLQTRFEIGEMWYMLGTSSDKEENFQGFHAPNQLNIVDEAGGVKANILGAIESIMTGKDNKVLYIGNPTVANGGFYNAFKDDTFIKITITVFDTPNFTSNGIKDVQDLEKLTYDEVINLPIEYPGLVTPAWAWDKLRRWGKDTPMFQSKVMAIFPEEGDDTLIRLSWIDQAIDKVWDAEEWAMRPRRNSIGIDVARFGSDSTVIMPMDNGKLLDEVIHYKGKDTMKTVGHAIALFNKLGFKKEFDVFVVDDTGVGGGVSDRLIELGYNVIRVNNAESAESELFRDIKAEMYWALRQAFIDGEISILDIERLVSDLSNIKYDITSNGKIFIKSKKDMKKEGLDSPDFADALVLAYYGSRKNDGGDIVNQKEPKSEDDDTDGFSIVGNVFQKDF